MRQASDYFVATSINPFSRAEHQVRCFKRWLSLGFVAKTFNVTAEADRLEALGVPKSAICVIADQDTAVEQVGKPLPRVAPIISYVANTVNPGHLLLVNSDIYPAIRSSRIVDGLSAIAGALALTREECHSVEAYQYGTSIPYRGGLDVFYLNREKLRKLNAMLEARDVSQRMTFGVPGWDYFMGALILSQDIGGRIMDGAVFLHPSHETTYASVSELRHYLADLRQLGVSTSDDPVVAASEFAQRINTESALAAPFADYLRRAYFVPTPTWEVPRPADEGRQVFATLAEAAPLLMRHQREPIVSSLAAKCISSGALDYLSGTSLFVTGTTYSLKFPQMLALICFYALCRARHGGEQFSLVYPRGNLHGKAVQMILDATINSLDARKFMLAELFAQELIRHNIFNKELFKYLALSCGNSSERRLLEETLNCVRRLSDVA